MIIVIDTREKHPLGFNKSKNVEEVQIGTLKVGDYSIKGYENKIAIERKSCEDLFGTLGKGHKRFQKELIKVKELNMDYFAIVIEESFSTVLGKDFNGSHWSSMRGDVIIQMLFTIKMKYGVDVIFCNNRNEASSIIRQLFIAYDKHMEVKNGRS